MRFSFWGTDAAVLWFEVTRHPTAEWLAQQITEAFPWCSAPTYLLRDNDRAYGNVFARRVKSMGIRDRPISRHSPWQNGYVERVIGTLRRECLDRVLIFDAPQLRRILSAYAAYYNQARTHLSLCKDSRSRWLGPATLMAAKRAGADNKVAIHPGLSPGHRSKQLSPAPSMSRKRPGLRAAAFR